MTFSLPRRRRTLAAAALMACGLGAAVVSPASADGADDHPVPTAAGWEGSAHLSSAFSSGPMLDHLGRPTPQILDALGAIAEAPTTPEGLGDALTAAIGFFRGGGTPGAQLPVNGPAFTQFLWPSVAKQCIGGTLNAVAPAIAVPGPASLPLPGVPAGQIGVVLTLLGTGPVADHQAPGTHPPRLAWLNLATGAHGIEELGYHGINPQGPATVSTTAATGSGPVAAAITPGVVTTRLPGNPGNAPEFSACRISPTAVLVTVPDAHTAPTQPEAAQ